MNHIGEALCKQEAAAQLKGNTTRQKYLNVGKLCVGRGLYY